MSCGRTISPSRACCRRRRSITRSRPIRLRKSSRCSCGWAPRSIAPAFTRSGTASLPALLARRLSFGNTIKKAADIAAAHRLGVDLFAFDSVGELRKLAASRARRPRLLPHRHDRRRRRLAARAQVRLRGRYGARPHAGSRAARPRPLRPLVPHRIPAARCAPVGRGLRPDGHAVHGAGRGGGEARHGECRRRLPGAHPQGRDRAPKSTWRRWPRLPETISATGSPA